MPRRIRLRKVVSPPDFAGYKPYGAGKRGGSFVELLYEEYEAIKLADYDLMNHLEAAKLMGVSRPTFARIYESARRKVAKAFVESREIRTVFGNALLGRNWVVCSNCSTKFTLLESFENHHCPLCKSEKINPVKQ